MLNTLRARMLAALCLLCAALAAPAQQLPLHVQGRVTVNGVPHNGGAFFKFALIRDNVTLWSNDGSSVNGSEPGGVVPITVNRGLWNVLLGDLNVFGMTQPIPPAIFVQNDAVYLRVWFNDSQRGFQQLIPDQRIAAVGYAMNAQTADAAVNLTGPLPVNLLPEGVILNNAQNVSLTGTFTGNGAGLVNVPGSLPWQVASGRGVQAVPQQGYLVIAAEGANLRLPANPQIGQIIRVSGTNAGGWKLLQNEDQSIKGHFTSEIGSVWFPRANARKWSAIAMSADGTRLLATVRDGAIWTSTDFGINWVPHPEVGQWQFGAAASSADGGTLVVGSTNRYITVSVDSGFSWQEKTLAGLANWSAVASSSAGSNLVAAANPGFIYTSADSGATWSQRAANRQWQGVASSANGTNLFAVANDFVYVSGNAGQTWGAIGAAGNRAWRAVAVNADASRILAAPANGQLMQSVNGGAAWNALSPTGVWSAVASSADGTVLAATKYGGKILVSTDGGASWTEQDSNRNWTGVAISSDGRRLAATVADGLIYVSEPSALGTTTTGLNGFLTGSAFSAVELQYAGNGVFFPISFAGVLIAH